MGVIFLEGLMVPPRACRAAGGDDERRPLALKRAIAVGIGLFILFIGFVDAGLIVNGGRPESPVPVAFVYPTERAHFLLASGC